VAHAVLGEQRTAYAAVFGMQALMFAMSAVLAMRLNRANEQLDNRPFDSVFLLKGGSHS
jgi:BCD family chlorophyll transporter-like MFS transporter